MLTTFPKAPPSRLVTTPNAHYIPEGTTIKVGEKTYNTADMFETAARSYLLLRGYDGLNTEKYGNKSIPALADGAKKMSETDVPETHGYSWGEAPCNETGSYDIATGQGSGNEYFQHVYISSCRSQHYQLCRQLQLDACTDHLCILLQVYA